MASRMSVDAEMKALLNGPALPCSKPHQLVPLGDDLVVAIASVAALDASLAAAPPFKRALRGYVLPTAPYKDAALLKAAAESGSYAAAARFVLVNHGVVEAKITLLDEAREQLENIVADLNALQSETLGRVRTQLMGRDLTAAQLARAAESSAQWADIVERTRREAQLEVGSTAASLKSIISIVLESASASA